MKRASLLVDFRHDRFVFVPDRPPEVRERRCRFVENAKDRLRRLECRDPQVSQCELNSSIIRLNLTPSESD